MSLIRKHSPEHLKPTANGAKALLGYLPNVTGVEKVGYFGGIDFLGTDLTLTDTGAGAFSLKVWDGTALIPSEARVTALEGLTAGYFTRAEYDQIEAVQIAAFNAALNAVDLKDLDVTEWMAAMANLVTKSEHQTTKDLLDQTKLRLDTAVQQIDTLKEQMKTRISNIVDFERVSGDMLKDANGLNYFQFPQPVGVKLVRSRMSCDGIPVPRSEYTTSIDGIVKFTNLYASFGSVYEIECFYIGDATGN